MTFIFGNMPLVGTMFMPGLVGILTFLVIWMLSKTNDNNNHRFHVTPVIKEEIPPVEVPKKNKNKKCEDKCSHKGTIDNVKIFFGTLTGKSKVFSNILATKLKEKQYKVQEIDLASCDPEDMLTEEKTAQSAFIFILPTHDGGKPPPSASWLYKWLDESANDFRTDNALLKDLKYAVFGLGSSAYKENYNVVGKHVDRCLYKLHATRIARLGLGDESGSSSKNWSIESDFETWCKVLLPRLKQWDSEPEDGGKCNSKCSGICKSKKSGKVKSKVKKEGIEVISDCEDSSDSDGSSVIDVEDLGRFTGSVKQSELEEELPESQQVKEMLNPALRATLSKQGYRLIGSHSGVKLCRWTKSMLRGRGGCYKHSFYGIQSHQCMETTPSLACANKCVFCWRHHSNPVGTEWRWKMDPAKTILEGALEHHYNMINQFKGVPGVLPERMQEGFNVKHCALSLVGEPIMYPEINEYVRLLHEKGISSFLVTNAQFPEAIRCMSPVTQLYVSVDASTKESLKKIDRPLFSDFWERFLDSLRALSEKGQRTVYRLTLVKAWNTEELESYAKLVEIGKPDFIEVKGVTYCGTSKASNLTMENVPWHSDVVAFVQKLADLLPEYEIASEHEHSNCVLIAHKKFKIGSDWWTWIDYEKFHYLIQRFYETNGKETFTALDYMYQTPGWATYGSVEQGFDPVETRWHRRNGVKKDISGC
ncbi:S-adenosyl-L-methionine-dependent tRNA 4-demethylwyosine synthase TYW1 [Anabrus simplex]|uniref:S-adenosyl-L-methionine-dependent tRNA 4-demethylwyosine synthase TYW1 n=1 Tax=Anabrus simplex TaxID=316456 RepID=UPI0035A27D7E